MCLLRLSLSFYSSPTSTLVGDLVDGVEGLVRDESDRRDRHTHSLVPVYPFELSR